MRDFLYKLVERLHDAGRPLSRNKHFHTFEGPNRKALRIDRHLRDLEAQLERLRARAEKARVRLLPGGGAQIVISDPRLSVVRTAILTREEVEILRGTAAGEWAMGASAEKEDAEQAPAAAAVGPGKHRR